MPREDGNEFWFWQGVLHGLTVAQVIGDQGKWKPWPLIREAIEDQHRKIRRRTERDKAVDGEAEYRSWLVELEMQTIERGDDA